MKTKNYDNLAKVNHSTEVSSAFEVNETSSKYLQIHRICNNYYPHRWLVNHQCYLSETNQNVQVNFLFDCKF